MRSICGLLLVCLSGAGCVAAHEPIPAGFSSTYKRHLQIASFDSEQVAVQQVSKARGLVFHSKSLKPDLAEPQSMARNQTDRMVPVPNSGRNKSREMTKEATPTPRTSKLQRFTFVR